MKSQYFLFFSLLFLLSCQSGPSIPNEGNIEPETFTPFANPPDSLPTLFEEGVVSTHFSVRDFSLSPQEDEFFFTLEAPGSKFSALVHSKKEGDRWTNPEIPAFSGAYRDLEAAFHPDGDQLFFCSARPLPGDTAAGDYNIWRVEQTEHGWGRLEALGPEVNSAENEFYPSVTEEGNLYFTGPQEGSDGLEDLFWCKKTEEGYAPKQRLSDAINSDGYEFNAFIDPYEQFIIFSSYGREDGLGGGDLYISYRGTDEEWEPAVNMGSPINSTSLDYCPFVSPNGKTLYFTSNRSNLKTSYEQSLSLAEFQSLLKSPLNGSTNIYHLDWQKRK